MSKAATVGLAVGCSFGAALLGIIAAWWKPYQIGRFISRGKWPKENDQAEARREIRRFLSDLLHHLGTSG